MSFPHRIRLVEVGPRDGLQNEPATPPAKERARLIELLADAGLKHIEAGSFVSPRAVPQMADTAEVLAQVRPRPGVRLSVLAPNLKGLDSAFSCNVEEVAVLASASESFSRRNLNCSIDESVARAREVAAAALNRGLLVRGYVSCVLGCPYQGEVDARRVVEVAKELHALGCYEVSLGDTIGVGAPLEARRLVEQTAAEIPLERLAGHFHDTYGQALANIFACLESGVSVFDSSVAGLGGCPYAPGATGNVATEDVVYMLQGCGLETGVDLDRLIEAGAFICGQLGRRSESRVARARAAKPAGARLA